MKNVTIFNNSTGVLSVKIIKANKTDVTTLELSSYEETDKVAEIELEVGDMVVIENEGG